MPRKGSGLFPAIVLGSRISQPFFTFGRRAFLFTMKSPAFQFYPRDWLASLTVSSMTPAQEGAYIRLLAYDWDNDGLPDDDAKLLIMSRLPDENALSIVKAQFTVKLRSGKISNKRLQRERKVQQDWAKTCKARGKSGATARWSKAKLDASSIAQALHKQDLSNAKPMLKNGSASASASASALGTIIEAAPIDLPRGFPKTEAAAVTEAEFAGIPADFAKQKWNLWYGTGGRDAAGRPIGSFRHVLASAWASEQNRKAEQATRRPQAPQKTSNIERRFDAEGKELF